MPNTAPTTHYIGSRKMPKKMHDALDKEAKKKGMSGERKDAYVYGTMNKMKKRQKALPSRGGRMKTNRKTRGM